VALARVAALMDQGLREDVLQHDTHTY